MTVTVAGGGIPRWRPAPVIGLAGLGLMGIGLAVDPRQAYASWLTAYAAVLSIALGALLLVAIANLSGARWFDPLRPLTLDVAGTLPLFGLFFLILLSGLGRLYPWVHAPRPANSAWLNPAAFTGRGILYFAIWIGTSLVLRAWARADSALPGRRPEARECALSAAALPLLGLSLTFAAFDWLMSLDPAWTSTAFGVYWFAGGFLAALALVTLVSVLRSHEATDAWEVAEPQAYALGALLLTFAVFWAYIAYSQYFIIWIADVPREVAWYLPRSRGGWGLLALVVLLGQFALPLLVLLFHRTKRDGRFLVAVTAWLLVMHYLDTYWLVLPAVHPAGPHPHWLDLSALMAIGGTTAAWTGALERRRA